MRRWFACLLLAWGCSGKIDRTEEAALGLSCTTAQERDPRSGGAVGTDLSFDDASKDCATSLCLSHYFVGRVSCPYGNDGAFDQKGRCLPAKDTSGAEIHSLYTIDGKWPGGMLCCPILDDPTNAPVRVPVAAQCSNRPASEAVYCSCRCDVPNDPSIDRASIHLCTCAEGFVCKPLCDATHGDCAIAPKKYWGSYCVKAGPFGADLDLEHPELACGLPMKPPS